MNWISKVLIVTSLLQFSQADRKVCTGTNNDLSIALDRRETYRRLVNRYSDGCTHVNGNLEIVGLIDPEMDLSFLESIREISGYVLIALNNVPSVPLFNLRVIRGETTWQNNSLAVILNHHFSETGIGLRELPLISLTEIMHGNVNISGNRDLCHVDTISWNDMMDLSSQDAIVKVTSTMCKECASNCNEHCWTTKHCQTLTKTICHSKCDYRCTGRRRRDCCHPECIAGCTGPKSSDCLACRNFDLDGQCVSKCPDKYIYDDERSRRVKTADGKVSYQSLCLDKCPEHLLEDDGQCVSACSTGKVAVEGGCHVCDGPCPKACPGIGNPTFNGDGYINDLNIDLFRDCNIIDGSVIIESATFDGDPFLGLIGINPEKLEAFSNVQEITGHLTVLHTPTMMADLSAFGNLKAIRGRSLYSDHVALTVTSTLLESLSLSSLKEVSNGNIFVKDNQNMCYASRKLLSSLLADSDKQIVFVGSNKPRSECREENGEECHSECSDNGCWGPSPVDCYACKNFDLVGKCVEKCDSESGHYLKSKSECGYCHEECTECSGPGSGNCSTCKHVSDEGDCKSQCPETKYADAENICRNCHRFCAEGCTGPSSLEQDGGCNSCIKPRFRDDSTIECIDPDVPAFICNPENGDCIDQCASFVEEKDEQILQLQREVLRLREQVVHLKEILKFHYQATHGRDIESDEFDTYQI
ncbi:epidermal growth factor receptor-like [Ptychodera flava]|uniref:epidermal growth factor receptor-like n=1 Tax=Ptychodera flava TaxID=63121 RepID=UPI003969FF4B